MYRSKETLQQAPLNKRKESYGPGPTERKDKTTVACCLREFPEPKRLRGKTVSRADCPEIGARQTLGTSKEVVLYHGIP